MSSIHNLEVAWHLTPVLWEEGDEVIMEYCIIPARLTPCISRVICWDNS